MNAEELEFENNYFNLVCGTGILHHLSLGKAVSEIKRVIKNEGVAVFVEPLGHNVFINYFRLLTPHLRTRHEHPLTVKDLRYLENRFRFIKVKYYYMISLFAILFKRFRSFAKVLKVLERIDNKIFNMLPFFKRYAW